MGDRLAEAASTTWTPGSKPVLDQSARSQPNAAGLHLIYASADGFDIPATATKPGGSADATISNPYEQPKITTLKEGKSYQFDKGPGFNVYDSAHIQATMPDGTPFGGQRFDRTGEVSRISNFKLAPDGSMTYTDLDTFSLHDAKGNLNVTPVQVKETVAPDGTDVRTFTKDGKPYGSITENPNGSMHVVQPNGTDVSVAADGTITILTANNGQPDGGKMVISPDGTITETPPGKPTTTSKSPDYANLDKTLRSSPKSLMNFTFSWN